MKKSTKTHTKITTPPRLLTWNNILQIALKTDSITEALNAAAIIDKLHIKEIAIATALYNIPKIVTGNHELYYNTSIVLPLLHKINTKKTIKQRIRQENEFLSARDLLRHKKINIPHYKLVLKMRQSFLENKMINYITSLPHYKLLEAVYSTLKATIRVTQSLNQLTTSLLTINNLLSSTVSTDYKDTTLEETSNHLKENILEKEGDKIQLVEKIITLLLKIEDTTNTSSVWNNLSPEQKLKAIKKAAQAIRRWKSRLHQDVKTLESIYIYTLNTNHTKNIEKEV